MAYCEKFCGGPGRWAKNPDSTNYFIHDDGDCQDYINRKLSAHKRQSTYQKFTTPDICGDCEGECFCWHEHKYRRKVYFDELGPPWPKHDHDACIKRQQQRPKPPWQWELTPYEPCVIYEAHPDKQFQKLEAYGRGLKSDRFLAIFIGAKDIRSFIGDLDHPFLIRDADARHW